MMKTVNLPRRSLLLAAGLSTIGAPSLAQEPFPSKPIRIIVPTPPGGNLDLVMRALSERLTASVRQSVIVENRVGGSSAIGTKYVAQSAPDGYTLIAVGNTFMSAPAVIPNISYDPIAEFVGITLICRIPNVLVVPKNSPFRTIQDVINKGKASPGSISYASAGGGSVGHFVAENFGNRVGIKMLHVPYKGNGPALIDLVGGQVDVMFDQVSTSSGFIRQGSLRALAVTSSARVSILPGVPTMAEAGLQGFEDYTINAILAPAATPKYVQARLLAEITKALGTSQLRDQFAAQGIELTPSASLEEFNAFVKSEVARYATLTRQANIKSD
jgi:tripartite-type tricarboxylate transporter receptor subunit TctC